MSGQNNNLTDADTVKDDLAEVQDLLAKHRLVEDMVRRQETPRHDLVESLVHRQHIVELRNLFARLPTVTAAIILSALPMTFAKTSSAMRTISAPR